MFLSLGRQSPHEDLPQGPRFPIEGVPAASGPAHRLRQGGRTSSSPKLLNSGSSGDPEFNRGSPRSSRKAPSRSGDLAGRRPLPKVASDPQIDSKDKALSSLPGEYKKREEGASFHLGSEAESYIRFTEDNVDGLDAVMVTHDMVPATKPDRLPGKPKQLENSGQQEQGESEKRISKDLSDEFCFESSGEHELMTRSNDTLKLNEGEVDVTAGYSPRSGSPSSLVDVLANELSDGMKLTEQQNFRLDAQRLSAVVSVFDPLLQESSTENLRRLSAPGLATDVLAGATTANLNRLSYNEYGARPKILPKPGPIPSDSSGTPLVPPIPPRISFQSPTPSTLPNPVTTEKPQTAPLMSSLKPSSGQLSPRTKQAPVVDFTRSLPTYTSSNRSEPDHSRRGIPSLQNGDIIQKSRSSTGSSSSSSLVDLPGSVTNGNTGGGSVVRAVVSETGLLRDDSGSGQVRTTCYHGYRAGTLFDFKSITH